MPTSANNHSQPRAWLAPLLLGLILAASAALRLWALARAPLWWDEGNNAYFAHASLADLLRLSRATMDTDPPAHRLALTAWLWLLGDGAYQLRALSALCGVLGVALAYAWATWLYDRRVGLAAAALLAVWPLFVFYSREGKPYSWVALFAGLSVYLWQRYLDGAPRLRWAPWLGAVACAALALGAHYYVALFMAAQGAALVAVLWLARTPWRDAARRLWRWLTVQLAAAALVAPWVALTYRTALGGAEGLPDVDRQSSLLAYGRQLIADLTSGPDPRGYLALAAGLLLLAAAVAALWRSRRRATETYLALLVLGALALGFIAQQAVGFIHARFFLYLLPPLAILAAAGLVSLGRAGLALAVALALVWGLALPAALGPPRETAEDLRPVAAALREHAQPGDGVIVGYIWQEGILRLVAPELPVTYHLGWYEEDTVEDDVSALFDICGRLWLLSYHAELQNERHPGGWWLENNAGRAYLLDEPPYLLRLYTCPDLPAAAQLATLAVGRGEPLIVFADDIALSPPALPPAVAAGDTLPLLLLWTVAPEDDEDEDDLSAPVVYVHLVDPSGALVAQSDGPPQNGLAPLEPDDADVTIEDARALLIPADAPPGAYHVLVGLYDAATGERLLVTSAAGAGADHVDLGTLRIE